MMRLTFARRLVLIVVLSVLVAWIGSLALFYLTRNGDEDAPQPVSRQIAALVELVETAPPAQVPLLLRAASSDAVRVRLDPELDVGTTSSRLAAKIAQRRISAELEALGGRATAVSFTDEEGETQRTLGVALGAAHLTARVGLNTGDTLVVTLFRMPHTNFLGLPIGFAAGIIGTAVGLLVLLLLHREAKPLARLAAQVDRIDFTGAPVQLPPPRSSAPEIRQLVEAFNRLQSRLSHLLRARLAMLGGISHDVRTFATRLLLRVEQMPASEARDRSIADIADMIRLLDDALLASRAGAGELQEELLEFDELVRGEVHDRLGEGAAIELHADPGALHVQVLGDRLALRRVVANLVDNALTYGGSARLKLAADAAMVTLCVDDDGPGIPPAQRELLLEPFVRLDSSRNRRTGGAGLGLAIVRNLVEAHHGTIAIADAPGGGARVIARLPLFRA